MIILVDVDEVLGSLHTAWLDRYNTRMGTSLKSSDIRDWDLTGLDINKKVLFSILWEPDLYDDVQLVHEADLGVRCLRAMGHRVVFVTSSTDVSAGAKMRWLQKYDFIPTGETLAQFKDVVICSDKSLLAKAGDVMVDDHFKNLEHFEGVRILFDRPHNRAIEEGGFTRLYGWEDVVKFVLRLCIVF